MAITFPSNPSAGDIFTSNGRSWQWDGSVWTGYGVLPDPTVFAVDATTDTVTVTGNLNVSGTTTTINTTELNVQDNIVLLNSGVTGVPSLDAGIEVERGDEANAQLLWDESAAAWVINSDFTVDTSTLHVDSVNDRVGIGTTSPAAEFEVHGSSNPEIRIRSTDASDPALVFGDAVDAARASLYYNISEDRLQFRGYDNANRMVIDSSGNVGIGILSPDEELHIRKNQDGVLTQVLIENLDQRLRIGAHYEAGVNQYSKIQSVNDSGSQGERLALNPEGGNVGIGTTTPDRALTVDSTETNIANFKGSNTTGAISFMGNGTTSNTQVRIGAIGDGMKLVAGDTERMRITSGGNVGIGTTSPAANLQVASQNRAVSIIDSGANNIAEVAFTSLGADSPAFGRLSGYDVDIFSGTTRAGLASRIHVNRGGKIGIGTTAPVAGVDIATTAGNTFTTNGWDSGLILNAASALRWRTSSGIDWGIGNSGSILYFFSSTSPTTGAAANYRMTINGNSGAVSIAGSLSKGSGSFRIPHPLPSMTETHNLVHSFVEAPRADNMYRGQVTLVDGAATVDLDDATGMTTGTFELLNRDTQCFIVNNQGWTAVRGSVSGSTLTIEAQDASCTDTVDWLVVGERQDQHMYDTEWTDDDGRVIVEPLRPVEPEGLEAE